MAGVISVGIGEAAGDAVAAGAWVSVAAAAGTSDGTGELQPARTIAAMSVMTSILVIIAASFVHYAVDQSIFNLPGRAVRLKKDHL